MSNMLDNFKTTLTKHLIVPVAAAAVIAGVGAYEFAKPLSAKAEVPAPSVPALGDNSVGSLLSVDQAMEKLAAHVAPAIGNVRVSSRSKPNHGGQEAPEDIQQCAPLGQC